jgi:hypothetical protein
MNGGSALTLEQTFDNVSLNIGDSIAYSVSFRNGTLWDSDDTVRLTFFSYDSYSLESGPVNFTEFGSYYVTYLVDESFGDSYTSVSGSFLVRDDSRFEITNSYSYPGEFGTVVVGGQYLVYDGENGFTVGQSLGIRIDAIDGVSSGEYAFVDDISLSVTAAVPEPNTYSLLLSLLCFSTVMMSRSGLANRGNISES